MRYALLAALVCASLLAAVLPVRALFELDAPYAVSAGILDALPDMDLVSLATRTGADGTKQADVKEAASDGNSTTDPADEHAARVRPNGSIVLSAAEHYGLEEIRSFHVGTRLCFGPGELLLGGSSLGSSLYREQSLNVGWSSPVGEGGAVRVRAHVMGIVADGIESRWAVALDPAVLWLLRGRVAVGLSLSNATGVSIEASPVSSRACGRLALILDDATLGIAMESEPGFPSSFNMGIELAATDWFRLRAAGGTQPGRFAFGLGIGARRVRRPVVDLAWQWHPRLGGSTFVSISFAL
jgi:hypothetical protein